MIVLTADAWSPIARAKPSLAGWQPCESAQIWTLKPERPAVLLLRLAREVRVINMAKTKRLVKEEYSLFSDMEDF